MPKYLLQARYSAAGIQGLVSDSASGRQGRRASGRQGAGRKG